MSHLPTQVQIEEDANVWLDSRISCMLALVEEPDYLMQRGYWSEWVIKFNGLSGDSGQRGP